MKNQEDINTGINDFPRKMTRENSHLFPKDFQEAFNFLEKNKGEILFKEKYYASQKDFLYLKVKELFEQYPDLPVRQVLLKIMSTLPDFLPAENLVEVTRIITTTWEELSKQVAA